MFLLRACFSLLCGVALIGHVHGADSELCDQCEIVTSQILGVADECEVGTIECLEAANVEILINQLMLCNADTSNVFETLALCNGLEAADEVYATLCPRLPETTPPEPLCYELVREDPNNETTNGLAAYDACECSNETAAGACSSECQAALIAQRDALGCCSRTLPFVFYFSTCHNESTPLVSLFEQCQVDLPDPCEHLFSDYLF